MSQDAPTTGADDRDRPQVIARPPLIYLGFLVLGLVLGRIWPAPFLADIPAYILGGALIALGVAGVTSAFRQLRRDGTNVQTSLPATAIVTDGLYRYSRNPIYVSMTAVYTGIGVAANSAWMLLLLVPLLAVMRYGVIAREERYLEEKFGDEYRRFRESVRRWL